MMELGDWLNEYSGQRYTWYVKRLSGNDTLANKTHQAGPYIPKELLFDVIPGLGRIDVENPDRWFSSFKGQIDGAWLKGSAFSSSADPSSNRGPSVSEDSRAPKRSWPTRSGGAN